MAVETTKAAEAAEAEKEKAAAVAAEEATAAVRGGSFVRMACDGYFWI